MSFQITVLKVLAGQPEGCLSLDDLRRAVAILISSGREWTDRTNALAARDTDLDIFSRSYVLRDVTGWHLTDAGRAFLASVETAIPLTVAVGEAPRTVKKGTLPTSPPIWPIGVNQRRPRRAMSDRRRPSFAVA